VRDGDALLAALASEKMELDRPVRQLRARTGKQRLAHPVAARASPIVARPDWDAATRRRDHPVQYAIDQYLKDGTSLESLLLTLYHGEISISKAVAILRSLWGLDAGLGFLADRVPMIEKGVGDWLERRIVARQPYVFLRSLVLKSTKARKTEEARVLLAIGVGETGYRDVLSVTVDPRQDDLAWHRLAADLKSRGLAGTGLFLGDNCPTIADALEEHFPGAPYQGNFAQFGQDILNAVSAGDMHETMTILESLEECVSAGRGSKLLAGLASVLERQGNREAGRFLKMVAPFQFQFVRFPAAHWTRLRDYSSFVRMTRDLRNWLRLSPQPLDSRSLQIVASAQLRHVSRLWARTKFLTFPA
jgi:transposase-like protein